MNKNVSEYSLEKYCQNEISKQRSNNIKDSKCENENEIMRNSALINLKEPHEVDLMHYQHS